MKGYPIIFLQKPIAGAVLAAGGGFLVCSQRFLSAIRKLLAFQLFITTSDFLIRKPKNFHV